MSTAALRYDKHRRRKIYPFEGFRVAPRWGQEGLGVTVDKGSITYVNETTKTQAFGETFLTVPKVSVTPVGVSGQANVNVFVTSVTLAQFVVQTSAPFTGQIDWIAIGD